MSEQSQGRHRIAQVLMNVGQCYSERPEDVEWLMVDTDAVIAAMGDGQQAVVDALIDTGWCDETDPGWVALAHVAAEQIDAGVTQP